MIKFYFMPVALLFMSCVDTNLKQTSINIDDAKEKGVFKQEYRPLINPIINNDSIKIKVVSAWTEAGWYYDDKYGKTIRTNGDEYLRIKVKDTLSNYYGTKWEIGCGFMDCIRLAGNVDMISTLKKYSSGDTIIYFVRRGYFTLSDSTYDTTQKVIFVPVIHPIQ